MLITAQFVNFLIKFHKSFETVSGRFYSKVVTGIRGWLHRGWQNM